MKETAPTDLWNSIDRSLDTDNKADIRVKESFDGWKEQAPPAVWNDISANLKAENSLDQLVTESFDGINERAPESVWSNIENELDINRVWHRILDHLNNRRRVVWWKYASAVVVLLMINPALLNLYDVKLPVSGKAGVAMEINGGQENTVGVVVDSKGTSANLATGIHKEAPLRSNVNEKELTDLNVLHGLASEAQRFDDHKNRIFNESHVSAPLASDQKLSIISLEAVYLPQEFEKNVIEYPVHRDNANDTTNSELKERFSIGLITSVSNTWIVDNEIRNGFRSGSLIENDFSFGTAYGLTAGYRISKKTGIEIESYFNNRITQRSQVYVSGNYIQKEVELNYFKNVASFVYRFQPPFRKSANVVKLGAYYSILKNSATKYDNVIISYNRDLSKKDFGLRLAVGKEYAIGSFNFGYGLLAEYGIKNILGRGSSVPRALNVTKNMGTGVYGNVAYRF